MPKLAAYDLQNRRPRAFSDANPRVGVQWFEQQAKDRQHLMPIGTSNNGHTVGYLFCALQSVLDGVVRNSGGHSSKPSFPVCAAVNPNAGLLLSVALSSRGILVKP